MAEEFELAAPDAVVVAVGARPQDNGQAFADRFGIDLRTYEELFASDDIDVVYLATPHAFHTDLGLQAIEAGKALVVEKSFTISVDDTRRLIEAARAKGTFLMEAMWTRFLPAMATLRDLIANDSIGEVRTVQGDLTAYRDYVDTDRLFNPTLGGGVVFDLGVYCLHFAEHILGRPDTIDVTGGVMPNGVDGEAGLLLGYDDGRFATIGVSFKCYGPGRMFIGGTKGWIDVPPRFHRMERLVLNQPGKEPQEISVPHVGLGYSYELAHVGECLRAGLTESPISPLDDTLAVQEMMAAALDKLRTKD